MNVILILLKAASSIGATNATSWSQFPREHSKVLEETGLILLMCFRDGFFLRITRSACTGLTVGNLGGDRSSGNLILRRSGEHADLIVYGLG